MGACCSNPVEEYDHASYPLVVKAAEAGDAAELRVLAERGLDLNRANREGMTWILIWCAFFNHVDRLRLLLEHGADVNRSNDKGNTAANFAAGKGFTDCLRILLEKGAQVIITRQRMWETML